ncbi:MAG: glycine betaine ABC transporter substrate-binding protein [Nitriliruptorales bacterium]
MRALALTALALAVLAMVGGGIRAYAERPEPTSTPPVEPVRIGAGPEAESRLLATIVAELLAAADLPAEVIAFERGRDARQAIELREVDVLPSYTGAVWLDRFGWSSPPGAPTNSYDQVKAADEQDGLIWLPPTEVNATFAFVVAGSPARSGSMQELHHLALAVNTDPDALLCVDGAYASRPDGLAALARLYAIRDEVLHEQVLEAAPDDAVRGVANGDCLAGLTTVTDGNAWLAGLRPLADNQRAFPAFLLAPVVTEELRERHPEVIAAIAPFALMTAPELAMWNGRTALEEPRDVVAAEAAETLRARHEELTPPAA